MKTSANPPLDSLFDLACRDGVDIRPTLLRVITDLYVQKPVHSPDEETQYVELALGLIGTVDDATRNAVVASLAHYPNAPTMVLRQLRAGAHAPASEANTAKLETAEPAPVESGDDDLVEMFFGADAHERRLILVTIDVAAETPAPRPLRIASDVIARLETAALQRNPNELSRTLERVLGISPELARRIAHDPSGEPIVVAAKAIGMKAAVLQRILLFVNPAIGQSIERVYDLARLFDEITTESALRIVATWQTGGKISKPAYQPVHWDDERRSVRAQATPSRHRAVHGHDEPAVRARTSNR